MSMPIIGGWIMFSLVTAGRLLSTMLANVVFIPSDGLVSLISYLGRGGLPQCWLCGTKGGMAAISARERSKGPLGLDSWKPSLKVTTGTVLNRNKNFQGD